MAEGAGLQDPTYLKLRRTGVNGRLRALCTPEAPPVFWLSGLERKGSDVTVDGVGTVCVSSPGKI